MNLKKRIRDCERRIEKLKSLHAPSILIENEKRWLESLKKEYILSKRKHHK